MVLVASIEESEKHNLFIEFARLCIYVVLVGVAIATYLFQPSVINYNLLYVFYGIVLAGLCVHLLNLVFIERIKSKENFFYLGFVLDAILLSLLLHYTGFQPSLFLFLNLINIFICGYMFQVKGAFMLALITSIMFSMTLLLGTESRSLVLILTLALNNIAYFAIAGLSGYLSEQISEKGISLKNLEELNRVLLENMPSAVVGFLNSGEVVQFNTSAVQVLGSSDLYSKNLYDFFPIFKNNISISKRDITQDKKHYHFQFAKVFSPELSQEMNIAVFNDVTEVKELENKLRQSEKLAAIGTLAAGIAHEIRNPLAGISGSVEMLSNTVSNPDDQKLMKIILREIDRLNNLISEFLDFAKPQSTPNETVDLVDLLKGVLQNVQSDSSLNQKVKQITDFPEKCLVLGVSDKLKQAFLNIIINAYHAVSGESAPEVHVSLSEESEVVKLKISDNGIGMTESEQKKIFEPFFTTKPKGTGLGLAITFKILESHNSQILVLSEKGKGTEFILTFPKFRK